MLCTAIPATRSVLQFISHLSRENPETADEEAFFAESLRDTLDYQVGRWEKIKQIVKLKPFEI